MTEHPIPRAERRRLARQSMRAIQSGGQPIRNNESPQVSQSFWWSFFLIILFFFVCTVYALVQQMELWRNAPYLPSMIGWAGEAGATSLLFWLIVRHRKQARWSRGIFFVGIPAILFGLIGGLIWTRTLAVWQDDDQFQQALNAHTPLISQTESWRPGLGWDADQCKKTEAQAQDWLHDVFRGSTPPSLRTVNVTLGVEQVLYQAGCSVDWDNTRDAMQVERARSQGRNSDVGVLKQVCQAMATINQKNNPWDPSRFGGADGMQIPVGQRIDHAEPMEKPTNTDQIKPLSLLENNKPTRGDKTVPTKTHKG
jgi:hypothetical protein